MQNQINHMSIDDLRDLTKKQEEEIKKLKKYIDNQCSVIKSLKEEKTELKKELYSIRERCSLLEANKSDLTYQLEEANAKIDRLITVLINVTER